MGNSRTCPVCGSDNIYAIAYGMPTPEALAKADEDKVLYVGCIVDEPKWYCPACDHKWPPIQRHLDDDEANLLP